MSALADRLARALVAVERIGRRLQASLDQDARLFPMTADIVRSDAAPAATARDAFLQRFQQMADHMLRKLLPRTLAAVEGTADFWPVRDMLDQPHRADVIDAVEPWLTLIELRNRLTHEYALSTAELSEDLNAAWSFAPRLLDQINRIRIYSDKHHLLDGATIDDF